MPYFFSKSVATAFFAPAEPTSRFSQYHIAIGEYLRMSPCEKEQFFSLFRGVFTQSADVTQLTRYSLDSPHGRFPERLSPPLCPGYVKRNQEATCAPQHCTLEPP
jgi:hypothetical protein